jgi:hypothetical protein
MSSRLCTRRAHIRTVESIKTHAGQDRARDEILVLGNHGIRTGEPEPDVSGATPAPEALRAETPAPGSTADDDEFKAPDDAERIFARWNP